MRRPLFFPAVGLIAMISFSCSGDRKADKQKITHMEFSLMNSGKILNYSTQAQLKDLEDKTTKPETAEKAKYWYSIAEKIVKLSGTVHSYLGSVKQKNNNNNKQLSYYKEAVLSLNNTLKSVFSKDPEFSYLSDEAISTSNIAALQNNIKTIENKLVTFCNMNVGVVDGESFYSSYTMIVAQNSQAFQMGELLEIKAGIGEFSKVTAPRISFGGTKKDVGKEGFAVFTKKVETTPGIYKLPVTINYFDQIHGTDEVRVVEIEYTVLKPCKD